MQCRGPRSGSGSGVPTLVSRRQCILPSESHFATVSLFLRCTRWWWHYEIICGARAWVRPDFTWLRRTGRGRFRSSVRSLVRSFRSPECEGSERARREEWMNRQRERHIPRAAAAIAGSACAWRTHQWMVPARCPRLNSICLSIKITHYSKI